MPISVVGCGRREIRAENVCEINLLLLATLYMLEDWLERLQVLLCALHALTAQGHPVAAHCPVPEKPHIDMHENSESPNCAPQHKMILTVPDVPAQQF